jgi:hypothetical protein
MKKINNKTVSVTQAGYVYIDGKKINTRPVDPFYRANDVIDDSATRAYVVSIINRRWEMVDPRISH